MRIQQRVHAWVSRWRRQRNFRHILNLVLLVAVYLASTLLNLGWPIFCILIGGYVAGIGILLGRSIKQTQAATARVAAIAQIRDRVVNGHPLDPHEHEELAIIRAKHTLERGQPGE